MILGEAMRNLAASRLRTLLVGFLVAGLSALITAGELRETSRLLDFQIQFAAAGGYIAVASAPDGVSIATCDRLNHNAAVIAAGAVRAEPPVEARHVPGRLFASASISRGVLDVWAPGHDPMDTPGWYVGPSAASELGSRGTQIKVGSRPAAPIAPIDLTRRNPEADRWLLDVVAPVGHGTSCWVEFHPGRLSAGMDLLAAVFADVEGLTVSEHVRLDQFAFDPVAALSNRPLQNAWVALGAASAVLIALTAWTRRGEIGLYRALGLDRARVVMLYVIEGAILLATSVSAGAIWASAVFEVTAVTPITTEQLLIAYRTTASGLMLGLAALPGVLLPFSGLSIAEQLKDR